MRPNFALSAILIAMMSCGESPSVLKQYETLHSELHIGEYLVRGEDGRILTVSRSQESAKGLGIVSLHPQSWELSVIEEDAVNARDLKVSKGALAYRDSSQLRYIVDNENFGLSELQLSKLRDFYRDENNLIFIIEDLNQKTKLLCLNHETGRLSTELEVGSRVLRRYTDRPLRYFASGDKGLELIEISDCKVSSATLLIPNADTQYIDFFVSPKQIDLAYLNENDGCLYGAEFTRDFKLLENEIIDGTPDQNYLGMDLQFFGWGKSYGIVYMDGWKLKPKLALKRQEWEIMDLPVKGSEGFYPLVLETEEDKIRLLWHSFRTHISTYDFTFEDLALVEIAIQP